MNPVVILVIAMIGISGGIVYLAIDSAHVPVSDVVGMSDNSVGYVYGSGGGGGGLPAPLSLEPVASIINFQICGNVPLVHCDTVGLPNSDVVFYWQVDNGVGCCHTFGCNYDSFVAFCGTPFTEFKLYDIVLDGQKHKWGVPQGWNYTCSNDTVWNYFQYDDVPVGSHSVTVVQKDCRDIVDSISMNFIISEDKGLYYIWGD
jgi:hypothetical protein